MRWLKYTPFVLVLIPLFFTGCTSMLLVKSAWSGNQIVVDGSDKDWGDTMFYIPSAQLTAGIRNDSNYLYMILKTTDRRQTFQIMGLGLTVWFDPKGGTGEKFGIHFPIGHTEGDNFRRTPGQAQTGENSSFVLKSPNELELLGVNENGPVRMTVADLKGIQLQMRNLGDGLIYELRVPLHTSAEDPYAINPKGDQVGIGFEGGKFEPRGQFERPGAGRGEGGEGMPGGEGGVGGEMPGGMEGGGMRGGERGSYSRAQGEGQAPKQIDFWLKVNLASGTQPSPTMQ